MNTWLVRGLAMTGVLTLARLALDVTMEQWPAHDVALRYIGLSCVISMAATWGFADGRRKRLQYPDRPERGPDLTMIWLAGGAFAGFATAALAWLLGQSGNSLLFELTAGAAWSLLLVFVAAMIGAAVSTIRANRQAPA